MYIVSPIFKTGLKDLDFLIPIGITVDKISKTMILVDNINDTIQIAKHLCSRLPKRIQKEERPNHIIYIFTANLTTPSRTKFLADLRSDETRIWICTKCKDMGINFLDIHHTIQYKISDYIILLKFFQRLGRGGKNVSCLVVSIVFVETWQILPDNMHTLKETVFKDFWVRIILENCDQITDVIARLYYKYIRLNALKTGNLY